MKFLNKIIFVNSASVKFSEVNLDGNVHFIGTQGVGKSTLLRAILFFYNADKLKLGIPREKKTFDEYYFPYQNSYIIYEVKTENNSFCALVFKSQGRAAFRFFDAAFEKKHFIDNQGKAYESWDKVRDSFGVDVHYTRIIHNYGEYRNILYGNNKGISGEFRKYALLESRQFQNIPRTIANVFLNSNLSAEFVKKTIIKSLNEEEIKIDLTTYSQTHLKDFETNLNDIRKFTDRNGNGENQLEKQSARILEIHSRLKYLENKIEVTAAQLGWALNHVKERQPVVEEQLGEQQQKRERVKKKMNELDGVFEKKKEKIQEEIGKYKNKLDEIKEKRSQYIALQIKGILERVSKRNSLELERKNLDKEREILTSQFFEIKQRYDALLKQLENELKEFENERQTEKNSAKENFLHFKEELNSQYESLFEQIRSQHKEQLDVAIALVNEKNEAAITNKIRRSDIKNRRFFEKETAECKTLISELDSAISKSENAILQASVKNKNLQKEWMLEETGIREELQRETKKQNERQVNLKENILAIEAKIESSKDSFYTWLNENILDWEQTIGKVIDEDHVLFARGLNPKKISITNSGFYGVSIETDEIDKKVKTVADLQKEKEVLDKQVELVQRTISDLNLRSNDDLEKLRKRFQPKIKEQKEIVDVNQYQIDQKKTKLKETEVKLSEWKMKAETDQKNILENIDRIIIQLSDEKANAEGQVKKIEGSISKLINSKKKEKEEKTRIEQQKLSDKISQTDLLIQNNRTANAKIESDIRHKQKVEFDSKGADTRRIDDIDLKLTSINKELAFIDNNRDKVAEYNKDKRELFDREEEFKNKKILITNQLATESERHNQQRDKLIEMSGIYDAEIKSIEIVLDAFRDDLAAFDRFLITDLFRSKEKFIEGFTIENKTEQSCISLISELNTTDNTSTKCYIDLQEAIHKFAGNFQENNLFSFKVKFTERTEYFDFADMLREFIDENKIGEYKTRFEARFAHIIRQIGQETNNLISKEGEISQVIREINNDFIARNFVGAIKSMELKTDKSANTIFQLLVEIKDFNEANPFSLGARDLFNTGDQGNRNEKAILLLKQLIKEMTTSGEKEITLSDSFELVFKIVENENDTGWVEKLTNVGSDGTDILVKAMINIMLLNVFKERAAKKHTDGFRLHCMMDEIGKLHPNNVKGILKFANDRNILLINSSPTSYNAADYRYTYLLSKDSKNITTVTRLVKKITKPEIEI